MTKVAVILSGYWGGLTLGRILTGFFGSRMSAGRLVFAASLLATVCVAVAALGQAQVSAVAYILAGFALGPIFAISLAWMTESLPARLIPFLLLAGSVGGVLMPSLLGWLYTRLGPITVPVLLACVATLLCMTVAGVDKALSRKI